MLGVTDKLLPKDSHSNVIIVLNKLDYKVTKMVRTSFSHVLSFYFYYTVPVFSYL